MITSTNLSRRPKPLDPKRTMRNISACFALLLSMLASVDVQAQQTAPDWLVEGLYGSGKMNTVVAVVAVILLGIGVWLFTQDRKLSRMEKRMEKLK